MGNAHTEIAQRHEVPDEDLAFVYARSEDSEGIFGLEMVGAAPSRIFIETAPHFGRHISKEGLLDYADVDYVLSPGDGTSHGATWSNLYDYLKPVVADFRHMRDLQVERQLDGLTNIAAEGSLAWGGGWTPILTGVMAAQETIERGMGWKQQQLFQGLAYVALNFKERQAADLGLKHQTQP